MRFIVKHKWLFYLIQFTWGLLMNVIGGLVFLGLIIYGKKPKRFYNNFYIVIGKNWGGLELGIFFLIDEHESERTKYHEAGHGLQNLIFGIFTPFLVSIPSAIRYWYRNLTPNKKHPPYDSIWFENQATKWGYKYYG